MIDSLKTSILDNGQREKYLGNLFEAEDVADGSSFSLVADLKGYRNFDAEVFPEN